MTKYFIPLLFVLGACAPNLDAIERDVIAPGEQPRAFNLKAGSSGGTHYEDIVNCNAYIAVRCLTNDEKRELDERLRAAGRM